MTRAKPGVSKKVNALLPDELIKAVKNDLRKPIAKGRTSSLIDDNVLDFAYYGREKKFFWKSNGFYQKLKLDGDPTPISYMKREKKYKCLAYMMLTGKCEGCFFIKLNDLKECNPPAPYWFQLLSLSMAPLIDIRFAIYDLDTFIYFLLFNAPKNENGEPNVNPFLIELDKFLKNLSQSDLTFLNKKTTYFKRENANDESDIEFYRSCSKIDQDWLKTYTFDRKVFDLRIESIIEEECDLNRIFQSYLPYQFCEYIVKKKKYAEFYTWIEEKENREKITFSKCCHMIMPQFQELYEVMFKWKRITTTNFEDLDILLQNHFRDLVKHKFYREVIFLMDHGFPYQSNIGYRYIIEDFIETCDSNMLGLLDRCDKEDVEKAINFVLSCANGDNNNITDYLLKIGYKLNEHGIYLIYADTVSKYSTNLDIIDRYLPSDFKLDFLKYNIANSHFNLLDKFITKYEGRFETSHYDFDSWYFTKKTKNYKKLCEKFGFYCDSSSSDYKPKKKSRKYDDDDSPKSKPKERYVIVSVCNKCAQNNRCAACHGDTNKNGNSAFICTKHRDELHHNCPICGNHAGTNGKLCYKCYKKYTTKCFKCNS